MNATGDQHGETRRRLVVVESGRFPVSHWVWALGVSLVIGIFYLAAMQPYLGANSDAGVYLDGARSFAAGHGYRFESFSGRPPIALYPPGTSLLFAPVALLFQDPDALATGCLVVLWLITSVGVLVSLDLLTGLGVPIGLAALGTLAMACSPHWFLSVASLSSDAPFAVLVWIGCWWWLRRSERGTLRSLLPVALVLLLAQSVRSAALALYVGLIAAELFQHRRRAIWSVPLIMGSWLAAKLLARAITAPGGLGYMAEWKRLIGAYGGMEWYWHHLQANLGSFLFGHQFHELVWPAVGRSPQSIGRASETASLLLEAALLLVWIGCLAMILTPWIRSWRRRRRIPGCEEGRGGLDHVFTFTMVAGATVGMLVVVPNHHSHFPRYLLWTAPFILAGLWHGISTLVTRDRLRAVSVGLGLSTLFITASNAWISYSILRKSSADHGLEEAKAFASEIQPQLSQDATVATSSMVPFIHVSERLGRPLFVQFYQQDLSTIPPGPWSERAQNCTFVIAHYLDGLQGRAAEAGWREISRSRSGKYVLYRTDGNRP